jgi:hypothetical protein
VTEYSFNEYLQEKEHIINLLENLPSVQKHTDDEDNDLDLIILMQNDDRRDKYLGHISPQMRPKYDSLLTEIYRFHYLGLLVPTRATIIRPEDRFYNRSQQSLRQVPRLIYNRLKLISPKDFLSIFPNVIGQISIHIEPTTGSSKLELKHDYSSTVKYTPKMDSYLAGTYLSEEAILTASSQLDKAIIIEGRHRRHLIMESIRNFHDLGILLPTPYPGLESTEQ